MTTSLWESSMQLSSFRITSGDSRRRRRLRLPPRPPQTKPQSSRWEIFLQNLLPLPPLLSSLTSSAGWTEDAARGRAGAPADHLHWPGGHVGRGADDGAGGQGGHHQEERLALRSDQHRVQEAHQSSAQTEETDFRHVRSSHWVSCEFWVFNCHEKINLSSPRTEASEVTVERILTKLMPTGAQVKEVFNTIPQYAFQDIPEQPRWEQKPVLCIRLTVVNSADFPPPLASHLNQDLEVSGPPWPSLSLTERDRPAVFRRP